MDASDVTFAILNYNGRKFLESVLPSVFAQDAAGFRVHVVDNCSTDDSADYVRREWPQVRLFVNEANLGVSRNLARAVETVETDYIALLNNDLELEPTWLEEMRAALERHPEAGAADGKMLNFYERDVLDGAGDAMAWTGQPFRRGHGELDTGQFDEPEEIFSASGGAALYRRRAFDVVGNFDGDLYAYYEDVDWGFRAQLHGFTTRYVPTARCYHMGSATMNAKPGRWAHLFPRNQILTAVKCFPGRLLLRHAPAMLLWQVKWLIVDATRGAGRQHLRGMAEALRMLPAWLPKRRELQRSRTIEPRALERVIT